MPTLAEIQQILASQDAQRLGVAAMENFLAHKGRLSNAAIEKIINDMTIQLSTPELLDSFVNGLEIASMARLNQVVIPGIEDL